MKKTKLSEHCPEIGRAIILCSPRDLPAVIRYKEHCEGEADSLVICSDRVKDRPDGFFGGDGE